VLALGVFVSSLVYLMISSLFPRRSIGTPAGFFVEFIGSGIGGTLVSSLLPLAIGISILRHRLWDIDVLIRRTLQYSLLSGLLALVFFGGTVLLQGVFGQISGERSAPLITVISTLAIAALFSPLRKIVQNFIDRRFYRQAYNTEQVMSEFSMTLNNEVNLDHLTQSILGVVDETMQPELLSIWIQKRNGE
jgi:hypothetical protein